MSVYHSRHYYRDGLNSTNESHIFFWSLSKHTNEFTKYKTGLTETNAVGDAGLQLLNKYPQLLASYKEHYESFKRIGSLFKSTTCSDKTKKIKLPNHSNKWFLGNLNRCYFDLTIERQEGRSDELTAEVKFCEEWQVMNSVMVEEGGAYFAPTNAQGIVFSPYSHRIHVDYRSKVPRKSRTSLYFMLRLETFSQEHVYAFFRTVLLPCLLQKIKRQKLLEKGKAFENFDAYLCQNYNKYCLWPSERRNKQKLPYLSILTLEDGGGEIVFVKTKENEILGYDTEGGDLESWDSSAFVTDSTGKLKVQQRSLAELVLSSNKYIKNEIQKYLSKRKRRKTMLEAMLQENDEDALLDEGDFVQV